MFNDKKILITGGSGSWGRELTAQLLEKFSPQEIRIYSRGEPKQVGMRRDFNDNPRLRFMIGDVRDSERLIECSKGVDYIFHLAALKHVPVCENNPSEAVKTNILGTQNVIKAALENSVKKVIYISTDKAVEPLNFYGMTKSIGEKLIINANNLTEETSFVCIRAGNVLGTSESVIPVFRKQIINANKITITNGDMTRFMMNLKQAISLIFKASIDSVGGEIFVTYMPSMRIGDLAEVMIRELGNNDTEIMMMGKRPGEKIHELLVSRDESERAFKMGEYFMILPAVRVNRIRDHYNTNSLQKVEFSEFGSSNTKRLNQDEIKEMLDEENWLSKDRIDKDVLYQNKDYVINLFKNIGWIKEGSL